MLLTRSPLAIDPLLAEVRAPHLGGTCVFLGTVRDGPTDGGVTGIEYSAYEPMAETELEQILAATRREWPDARIVVRHRLGLVAPEEASIAIVVAAPHRAEAFAACRFVIEEVKRSLPIWKKELRADGTATWVDPQGHPSMVGPE
jgi:molybdopterin synthase catalytic subunit